jgi:broad specificity phosphatase PhoE
MKALFIRHGESEFNKKGFMTGITDVGLTKKGFQQAKQVAEKLHDSNFDQIICSPLLRARQTAKPLAEISRLKPILWEELYEVNYGQCQGAPKEYDLSSLEMIAQKLCPGSETLAELESRAGIVVAKLKSLKSDKVVIVGHRTFTSIIFAVHKGLDRSEFAEFRKGWEFKNGEIKVLIV